MKDFPLTIVDNWFPDPDRVLQAASELEFNIKETNYLGPRTDSIHASHPDIFNFCVQKLMSMFFFGRLDWQTTLAFQKILPFDDPESNIDGIHLDKDSRVVFIIYLNKSPEINTGTSVFTNKNFTSGATPANFQSPESIKEMRKKYEDFDESVVIANKFNRCVIMPRDVYHAGCYGQGKTERLTLTGFCWRILQESTTGVMVNAPGPLERYL